MDRDSEIPSGLIVMLLQLICRLGLVSRFFDFLGLDEANNNVHNIRLCRQIVAAGAAPAPVISQLQAVDKVRPVHIVAVVAEKVPCWILHLTCFNSLLLPLCRCQKGYTWILPCALEHICWQFDRPDLRALRCAGGGGAGICCREQCGYISGACTGVIPGLAGPRGSCS